MKEYLQHLIQKNTEGNLNLKEQIELSNQLADPHNSIADEILLHDWKDQLESTSASSPNLNPILDRVHHRIRMNENVMTKQINWWLSFQRIAAILIIPLIISGVAYLYFQSNKSVDNGNIAEIQCPMGARIKFQLPDGSIGFLNSGSKLSYPVQFTAGRSVELIGEAYFEVVHNENLPFHVNTKNLDIKVLGTTFDVIANENENTEEIVLQTGKVDVSSKNGKQLAVLKPNEQLTLDLKKRTFSQNKVEASQYTGWKEGKLIFRNENMQQVARRLSRWYNADIVLEGNQLDTFTFHATFIDESLDEVLKLLSLTTPLSYSEGKRIRDSNGVYQKRKFTFKINHSKINQFR
jgi:ferric-dicitrate binding protein FerR (iron transport regulator)